MIYFFQNDEITVGLRDGSAHVLRCLKVWYDLPSDVLFFAINLMDRFLSKMKAKQKHMACISVSSFYIAAVHMAQHSLDAEHLVLISQCKCTSGDLKRMADMIRNKLQWVPGTQPITSLTFLRLFNMMFQAAASQLVLGDLYASMVSVCNFYVILNYFWRLIINILYRTLSFLYFIIFTLLCNSILRTGRKKNLDSLQLVAIATRAKDEGGKHVLWSGPLYPHVVYTIFSPYPG